MRRRAIPGALALLVLLLLAATAGAARPLETAVYPGLRGNASDAVVFERIKAAGASKVRIALHWRKVAPAKAPAAFDAANPADPAYRWGSLDREIRLAASNGLEPIVFIFDAPDWAEGTGNGPAGTVRPSPQKLAQFARAAALRYSGSFGTLPRVRFWQIWNEPNLEAYLWPQLVNEQPWSPDRYRAMVNAAAAALKAVSPDNVVIAGGLSPFSVKSSIAPMTFMRRLLCLSKGAHPHSVCSARVRFDVWAHHPYTSGGPRHHAANPDDVSLGDLPEMNALLRAGERAGKIVSDGSPQFWVTEFSWDSQPLDTKGLPLWLHARWTAEALYQMWKSGVTLATWFLLVDQAHEEGFAQSGLYRRAADGGPGAAKPTLTAFRFPFVAYKRGNGLFVWGRTPTSRPASVAVEQKVGGAWRRVSLLEANQYGIFTARVSRRLGGGDVRARLVPTGGHTLAFSLVQPPDREICPFGSC